MIEYEHEHESDNLSCYSVFHMDHNADCPLTANKLSCFYINFK